jgi:hypothetical protein
MPTELELNELENKAKENLIQEILDKIFVTYCDFNIISDADAIRKEDWEGAKEYLRQYLRVKFGVKYAPPYPFPECEEMKTVDIDFCLLQGKHGCKYLESFEGHTYYRCGLALWKLSEEKGF